MHEVDHCQGCGAPISWARTLNDKPMPVEPRRGGNVIVVQTGQTLAAKVVGAGQGDHVSHFVSCPEAGRFRRGR